MKQTQQEYASDKFIETFICDGCGCRGFTRDQIERYQDYRLCIPNDCINIWKNETEKNVAEIIMIDQQEVMNQIEREEIERQDADRAFNGDIQQALNGLPKDELETLLYVFNSHIATEYWTKHGNVTALWRSRIAIAIDSKTNRLLR